MTGRQVTEVGIEQDADGKPGHQQESRTEEDSK